MQRRTILSKTDQSLENIIDDFITHLKQSKEFLEENQIIIDRTLQNLFKGVDLDLKEILPGVVVVSTILGMLICRILRHWNKEIPTLTSDVEILEILEKAIESDFSIDLSLWKGIRSATQILQNSIDKKTQSQLIAMIATCNLHELLLEDVLGSLLQKLLPHSLHKSLAANYTSLFSSELLAKLAVRDGNITVIDPFCGSGRLLTAVLDQTSQQDVSVRVEGNELLGIATILALARILYWFKFHCRIPNLSLTIGDAFEQTPPLLAFGKNEGEFLKEYDLVIMNPPFTRYLRLQPTYLKHLFQLYAPYSDYMEKQMGLHVFAIFLADRILKPGGRLAAVLPAPTFYSSYADGLKRFLLKKYQLKFVIGTTVGKAFSEGSDLKEILFIADKRKPASAMETIFATIEVLLSKENIPTIVDGLRSNTFHGLPLKVRRVGLPQLESNWNWIRFLEIGALQDLTTRIRQVGKVKSAQDLNLRIVRGFEMYGPEFFFIPNKNWKIIGDSKNSDFIVVQHKKTNQYFEFQSDWLIRAFRKPALYNSWITPQIDHFALKISNEQDPTLLEPYISANPETWQVAVRRFGPDWITHIHAQLKSKHPYGHLFIVDKFGVTTTGILAHFTDERLTASKNFYVIDCPKDQAKLLAAWMNSTLFILLFLASRREIGGSYGRLQIIDYLTEPLFIDPHTIDPSVSEEIECVFDTFRSQPLPPLKDQLTLKTRNTLDLLVLKALGFPNAESNKFCELIYQEVKRLFSEIDNRSRHKRRRK